MMNNESDETIEEEFPVVGEVEEEENVDYSHDGNDRAPSPTSEFYADHEAYDDSQEDSLGDLARLGQEFDNASDESSESEEALDSVPRRHKAYVCKKGIRAYPKGNALRLLMLRTGLNRISAITA